MRASGWRAAALVLGSLAVAACQSDQPTQTTSQTVSLTLDARANNVKWNCWDNVGAGGVYCEEDTGSTAENRPVPWQYDVEISLLRAGETTPEIVASTPQTVDVPDGFPVFGNMSEYDLRIEPGPTCPQILPAPCTDTYANPRKVSQGSRDYAAFRDFALPVPNLLSRTDGVYTFTARKGDTILVVARKSPIANMPQVVANPFAPNADIIIEAGITVDGRPADPRGTVVSGFGDGAGLSFSYTLR